MKMENKLIKLVPVNVTTKINRLRAKRSSEAEFKLKSDQNGLKQVKIKAVINNT